MRDPEIEAAYLRWLALYRERWGTGAVRVPERVADDVLWTPETDW